MKRFTVSMVVVAGLVSAMSADADAGHKRNFKKSSCSSSNYNSNHSSYKTNYYKQNVNYNNSIYFCEKNLHHDCQWWFDACATNCCHNYNKHYVHDRTYWKPCHWYTVSVPQSTYVDASQWFLGLDGIVVPETGLGVQGVKLGSPAERAGLRPGQLIVAVNGQPLLNEAVLVNAIQTSGGVLTMDVVVEGSHHPQQIVVYLARVQLTSF